MCCYLQRDGDRTPDANQVLLSSLDNNPDRLQKFDLFPQELIMIVSDNVQSRSISFLFFSDVKTILTLDTLLARILHTVMCSSIFHIVIKTDCVKMMCCSHGATN